MAQVLNGRVSPKSVPPRRQEAKAPDWKAFLRKPASPPREPASPSLEPPSLLRESARRLDRASAGDKAASSRQFRLPRLSGMAPVFASAGAVLIMAALVGLGASERGPDMSSFVLPDDGLSAGMLLTAISPLPPAVDESAPMPELPLTLSVSSYTVASRDTLDSISKRFGVRLDTLISLNGITDVRRLRAGSVLKIPNLDGVAHVVRKGESLGAIAASAGVSVLDLVDANDLSSQIIRPGQTLFIPGARLSSTELKRALGTLVMWPASGRISSYYGYRPNPFTGIRQFHTGLDIVAPENSPVKAAMDGRVAETGYSALFGNFVILSHSGGYQTLYAHLNKILVKAGRDIAQGATLGLVGNTGYSTAAHLHFGVYKGGAMTDPLKLLP